MSNFSCLRGFRAGLSTVVLRVIRPGAVSNSRGERFSGGLTGRRGKRRFNSAFAVPAHRRFPAARTTWSSPNRASWTGSLRIPELPRDLLRDSLWATSAMAA